MAQVCGDKNLIQCYLDGIDVHIRTGTNIYKVSFEELQAAYEQDEKEPRRQLSKNVNFGCNYKQTPWGLKGYLWKEAGLAFTIEDTTAFINGHKETFPGIYEYHDKIEKYALQNWDKDLVMRTLGMRQKTWGARTLPRKDGINSYGPWTWIHCSELINYPIQGSVADGVKLAMANTYKFLESWKWSKYVRMLLQVHDELLFYLLLQDDGFRAEWYGHLNRIMVTAMEPLINCVPVIVDHSVGESWGETKKYVP